MTEKVRHKIIFGMTEIPPGRRVGPFHTVDALRPKSDPATTLQDRQRWVAKAGPHSPKGKFHRSQIPKIEDAIKKRRYPQGSEVTIDHDGHRYVQLPPNFVGIETMIPKSTDAYGETKLEPGNFPLDPTFLKLVYDFPPLWPNSRRLPTATIKGTEYTHLMDDKGNFEHMFLVVDVNEKGHPDETTCRFRHYSPRAYTDLVSDITRTYDSTPRVPKNGIHPLELSWFLAPPPAGEDYSAREMRLYSQRLKYSTAADRMLDFDRTYIHPSFRVGNEVYTILKEHDDDPNLVRVTPLDGDDIQIRHYTEGGLNRLIAQIPEEIPHTVPETSENQIITDAATLEKMAYMIKLAEVKFIRESMYLHPAWRAYLKCEPGVSTYEDYRSLETALRIQSAVKDMGMSIESVGEILLKQGIALDDPRIPKMSRLFFDGGALFYDWWAVRFGNEQTDALPDAVHIPTWDIIDKYNEGIITIQDQLDTQGIYKGINTFSQICLLINQPEYQQAVRDFLQKKSALETSGPQAADNRSLDSLKAELDYRVAEVIHQLKQDIHYGNYELDIQTAAFEVLTHHKAFKDIYLEKSMNTNREIMRGYYKEIADKTE